MVRHSARFLAPVALATVAVGVYLIIHANVSTSTTAGPTNTVLRSRRRTHHADKPAAKARFYIVKSGDTLSEISSRTGIGIARLASLNPSLNPPYNLQTGQRLRLRR